MHSVGKEPEFTSVFSPPERIWMPFVVSSVYTNSPAAAWPSLCDQRWQWALHLHSSEWHYSVVSHPASRVWPPDVCVTENKQRWEQKITGKWLLMEAEWQRKTCVLHFVPPAAALMQREWHKQRHIKDQGNRKIPILHEKAKLCFQNWQVNKENNNTIRIKLTLTWHICMHHLGTSKLKKKMWDECIISKDRKVCLVKKFPRAICGCRSGETDAAE